MNNRRTYMNHLVVLLIRLFLFFILLLPASPPHDGLCLVLFTAQVVSVRQAGAPHHFSVDTAVSSETVQVGKKHAV